MIEVMKFIVDKLAPEEFERWSSVNQDGLAIDIFKVKSRVSVLRTRVLLVERSIVNFNLPALIAVEIVQVELE